MSLKVLTFESSSGGNGGTYDITTPLSNVSLVLANARIDIKASANVNTVSIELGNVINSTNVIDNDTDHFYLKMPLVRNLVNVSGTDYFMSYCQPMIGFKASGDITRQIKFQLRKEDGNLITSTDITYFCFQFQVIEN